METFCVVTFARSGLLKMMNKTSVGPPRLTPTGTIERIVLMNGQKHSVISLFQGVHLQSPDAPTGITDCDQPTLTGQHCAKDATVQTERGEQGSAGTSCDPLEDVSSSPEGYVPASLDDSCLLDEEFKCSSRHTGQKPKESARRDNEQGSVGTSCDPLDAIPSSSEGYVPPLLDDSCSLDEEFNCSSRLTGQKQKESAIRDSEQGSGCTSSDPLDAIPSSSEGYVPPSLDDSCSLDEEFECSSRLTCRKQKESARIDNEQGSGCTSSDPLDAIPSSSAGYVPPSLDDSCSLDEEFECSSRLTCRKQKESARIDNEQGSGCTSSDPLDAIPSSSAGYVPHSSDESCSLDDEFECPLRLTGKKRKGSARRALEDTDPEEVITDQPLAKKRRIFRATHCCVYCKKKFRVLKKHLLKKHSKEIDVKTYIQTKNNAKKTKIFKQIAHEGDIEYNKSHPASPIVARQSSIGKRSHDRVICPYCSIYVSSKHVVRHIIKHHPGKQAMALSFEKCGKGRIAPEFELEDKMSPQLLNFWKKVRNENRRKIIASDPILVQHGNTLFSRQAGEKRGVSCRNRILTIARIVEIMMKKDATIESAADCTYASRYKFFAKAIDVLAGKGEGEEGGYSRPTVVDQYGATFKKFVKVVSTEMLMSNDREGYRSTKDWIRVYDVKFSEDLGNVSRKQGQRLTHKQKQSVPRIEDVVKLNNYINATLKKSFAVLRKSFDSAAYVNLVESLFLRVWIFNKRRVGEVVDVTLKDYSEAKDIATDTTEFSMMTPTEQTMSQTFRRLCVRGKGGKTVSMLFHKKDLEAIQLMLSLRSEANIPPDNPYLFTTRSGCFIGTSIMRKYANKCGAKVPSLLKGTQLRKFAAMSVQYLNMTEEDYRQLSQVLGHKLDTHFQHYRKPAESIHLGRMSKLLMALDKGDLSKYKGKTIEEIEPYTQTDEESEDAVNEGADEDDHRQTPVPPEGADKDEPQPPVPPEGVDEDYHQTPTPPEGTDTSDQEEPWAVTGKGGTPGRKRRFRRRVLRKPRMNWTTSPLKKLISEEFSDELSMLTIPNHKKCKEVIHRRGNENPSLLNVSPIKLKLTIANIVNKKKRQ